MYFFLDVSRILSDGVSGLEAFNGVRARVWRLAVRADLWIGHGRSFKTRRYDFWFLQDDTLGR